MTRRQEVLAWTVAALSSMAGAAGWRATLRETTVARTSAVGVASGIPQTDGQALASHAAKTVSGDPFRIERKPANVAFGVPPAASAPAPSAAQRPRLVVSGIIGPPWRAVLEGIPGREGSTVVIEGQAFGELRVRSIRRDTVVVAGRDTTWKLTVRRPW
jgi:hypothetical protein